MGNQEQVRHVPAGTGPAYWGPASKVTFLLRGAESGGGCFICEVVAPPGEGPPPHMHHREEESFYMLEGSLVIRAGEQMLRASAGDFMHIPRGTVHTYRNDGRVDARFITVVTPAGPTGLEKFFEESFYPADQMGSPPAMNAELMGRLKAAAGRNGVEFVLPASR